MQTYFSRTIRWITFVVLFILFTQRSFASTAIVTVDNMNLRTQPNPSGHLVCKVKKGTKVTIYDRERGYCLVSLQDLSAGWLLATGLGSGAATAHVIRRPRQRHEKQWVVVEHFDGSTNQQTEPFEIDAPGYWMMSWTSSPSDVDGQSFDGNFIADLKRADGSDYDKLLVNTMGDHNGQTNIYDHGEFFLDISADENWSVDIYEYD